MADGRVQQLMSDRPANGHWTVETLREYLLDKFEGLEDLFGTKIDAAEKLTNLALENSKEAVAKAENANNERFKTTNEWRQTVNDITGGLASKTEVANLVSSLGGLTTRFERMESSNSRREGDRSETKEQKNQSTQMTLMAVGIVVSILLSAAGWLRNAGGAPAVPQVVYVPTPPATTAPTAR
jgi:hypothetical protein